MSHSGGLTKHTTMAAPTAPGTPSRFAIGFTVGQSIISMFSGFKQTALSPPKKLSSLDDLSDDDSFDGKSDTGSQATLDTTRSTRAKTRARERGGGLSDGEDSDDDLYILEKKMFGLGPAHSHNIALSSTACIAVPSGCQGNGASSVGMS